MNTFPLYNLYSLIVDGTKRGDTMEIIYIGVVILFFALSWGLVKFCEKL